MAKKIPTLNEVFVLREGPPTVDKKRPPPPGSRVIAKKDVVPPSPMMDFSMGDLKQMKSFDGEPGKKVPRGTSGRVSPSSGGDWGVTLDHPVDGEDYVQYGDTLEDEGQEIKAFWDSWDISYGSN